MAYATLLHIMTQLSKRSLSSLGGATFVWQVRFGIFGCVGFGKLFWLCCNGDFRFECMNTLELALKFGRRLMAFFQDFSISCPNIICQCPPGVLWKFGAW